MPLLLRRGVGETGERSGQPDASAWPFYRKLGAQAERWVFVRDEDDRVAEYSVPPTEDALDEIEQPARVAAGEEDREPGEDDRHDCRKGEEDQDDEVRD